MGSGHFGQVYKAKKPLQNEPGVDQVGALKVLNWAADGLSRETMRNEIVKIAKLRHPNLSYFIGDGETENNEQWFVMEFVEGQGLYTFITQRNRALNEAEWFAFCKAMLSVLKYLREKNVSHLDIKPDNIIRAENGSWALVDFGLATKTFGNAFGVHNDNWAAPEQFGIVAGSANNYSETQTEKSTHSPASDVFSMAISIYFAFSGVHPWQYAFDRGYNFASALASQLPARLDDLPDSLRFWLQPALAINPASRPSASELLAELELIGGEERSEPSSFANPRTWNQLEALLLERMSSEIDAEISIKTSNRGDWLFESQLDGAVTTLLMYSPSQHTIMPAIRGTLHDLGWRKTNSVNSELYLELLHDDVHNSQATSAIIAALQKGFGLAIENISINY